MKPFVAWDGEAVRNQDDPESRDHPYSLFGSSLGWRVRSYNLTTMDCLSLLLETETQAPDSIHFGFGFGYDANMVLRNLPIPALHVLRRFGRVRWEGFDIEYIPRKWFRVGYGKPGYRTTIQIFDVFSFFGKGLAGVLRDYSIGSPEQIQRIDAGKGERPDFSYDDIVAFIEPYWETELVLMVELMEKFRSILETAGIHLTSWHGPGAIASFLLRKNNVRYLMDRGSSEEILEAARFSYFGGRFEPFLAGFYDGTIYSADINSAYPYSYSRLPSLSAGKWMHGMGRPDFNPSDIRLGMYRIHFGTSYSNTPMPLPHREKAGNVCFPPATEGWIHAAEASMVYTNPNAEFLEWYVFEDDGSYPFSWIEDLYWQRLEMQKAGDPTQIAFKLGPNSLYGQVAQRAGWERTGGPPKWHQLEWAGAITSECRSMVYAAAKLVGKGLVSIDTDGILSLVPFKNLPNGEGNKLGQWKVKTYTGMFYIQNGIYWLRDSDGNWLPPKSRGIPRKKLEFSRIFELVEQGKDITIEQHSFVGFGLALRGRIDEWRHWVDEPRTITFGGTGKRIHNTRSCSACRKGLGYTDGLHVLLPVPPQETLSYPHNIPWHRSESDTSDFTRTGLAARLQIMEEDKWGIFE
jgi:DNA polymerase type B, organellar and viral